MYISVIVVFCFAFEYWYRKFFNAGVLKLGDLVSSNCEIGVAIMNDELCQVP